MRLQRLLILALAGALGWFFGQLWPTTSPLVAGNVEHTPSNVSMPPITKVDLEPAQPWIPDVPISPRQTWQPLPPNNMPLRASFALLKARADQGDARAACRLSVNLGQCAAFRPAMVAGAAPPAKVKAIVEHCTGMSDAELDLEHKYLRQAALAGNLRAIESYASGRLIQKDLAGRAADLEAYRREAPKLFEVAAQHGSADAVSRLAYAYGAMRRDNLSLKVLNLPFDNDRAVDLNMLHQLVSLPPRGDPFDVQARLKLLRQRFEPQLGAAYAAREKLALARFKQWFHSEWPLTTLSGLRPDWGRTGFPDFNEACSGTFIESPMTQSAIDWSDEVLRD